MDREPNEQRDITQWVELAEAELLSSGSFFMGGDDAVFGHSVILELRKRHPGCHVEGFQMAFEKMYALWSDDRLRARS